MTRHRQHSPFSTVAFAFISRHSILVSSSMHAISSAHTISHRASPVCDTHLLNETCQLSQTSVIPKFPSPHITKQISIKKTIKNHIWAWSKKVDRCCIRSSYKRVTVTAHKTCHLTPYFCTTHFNIIFTTTSWFGKKMSSVMFPKR